MNESDALEGRVIKSHGNRFIVQSGGATYDCGLRGKMRLSEDKVLNPVAVGDFVEFIVEESPYGVIDSVSERRNKISRPDVHKPDWEQVLVANCDQLVVISALARPKLKYGAIDRFLLIAEREQMDGIVVLNKVDVAKSGAADQPAQVYRDAGYTVLVTSAMEGQGLEGLRKAVSFKSSIFAGHSGVGKSSLLNALDSSLNIRTADISEATGKGAHTTTAVELYPLSFGGYVVDMPGIRAIGLWGLTMEELPHLYREFKPYLGQCRFNNCMHIGEPGCPIRDAVDKGTISRERYDGYLRIRETLS